MMKFNVAVPFKAIVDTLKLLLMVGGATTVVEALAVVPVPPLVDEITPVVLFFTPAVVPVTVTLKIQLLLAAMLAPDKLSVPGVAVVNVPPHCTLLPFASVRPEGSMSVNPTPVNAVVEFGLVIVKVSGAVPFRGIVAAPKFLASVGGTIVTGDTTFTVATAESSAAL
jgi:hypothetical protein